MAEKIVELLDKVKTYDPELRNQIEALLREELAQYDIRLQSVFNAGEASDETRGYLSFACDQDLRKGHWFLGCMC